LKKVSAVFLSSFAVLALLAGCANTTQETSHGDHGDHSDHSETMETMGETETMFATMMIPHHQQAIDMSELALNNSTNQDVRKLAQQIIDAQAHEIEQMQAWIDGHGHEVHGDHEMAGMASEEDMAKLATLESPEFDELFLNLMIVHHEGALDMVSMLDGTEEPEAKELAKHIVEVQKAEIALMNQLLQQLGS
jgi:uncharacterized protein (DUF305 family)